MIFVFVSKQKIERKNPINELLKQRLGTIDDFNFVKVDGNAESVPDFVMEASSLPFGSEKKAVLVESPFYLKDKNPEFENEKDEIYLREILENPTPEIDIIYSVNVDDYVVDANDIAKLIVKKAKVNKIEQEKDMVSRIISRCKKRNVEIDRNAAQELANRIGNDLNAMVNETNKLIIYTDHITLVDVTKLTTKPLEENVFAISNALIKGQNMVAFDIYRDLKVNNVEPITLVSMLGNQFRMINQAKSLLMDGYGYQDIAKSLNISEVRGKITCQNARNFSLEKISDILKDLADLDYKIKSGQVDRFYSFELFLINFKRN